GERRFLVDEGVLRSEKSTVLANGSIAGIDIERFRPDSVSRARIRALLKIDQQATVLIFLGRIARDKGILDLARAFKHIAGGRTDLHLIVAGPDEENLQQEISLAAEPVCGRLHFPGLLEDSAEWLAAADVLCLPSYREGFPVVVLEAAAVGIPSLGSRIYGVTDAIVEGRTGLLHEPSNVPDIVAKLTMLVGNPALRQTLGQAALARARTEFDSRHVVAAMVQLYARLIGS
ncbi:MAG: glycosyltransferase, partial [Betaproteobacteria bacterium]|nr:glycosyltransferase [Betaproteobacteria bacterium]